MKKYILLVLSFLIVFPCFAVDTDLGKFNLTEKQFSRIKSLQNANIKGFSYHSDTGNVVVVSLEPLKDQEISWLQTQIKSFPDAYLQTDLDAQAEELAKKEAVLQKLKISSVEWEQVSKDSKDLKAIN